jgi:chromate transporter
MIYMHIFWTFLKLGCSSFGGPIAHLMYFRTAFVEKRQWLTETEYSNLVALCQTLPGPASSQVGFGIGLGRGGLLGGLLAFTAFTLPSVLLLILFANYLFLFATPTGQAALQGLAILAFAVVLQGVLSMGKNLCFTTARFAIALMSFVLMLLVTHVIAQIAVIFIGAIAGYLWISTSNTEQNDMDCNNQTESSDAISARSKPGTTLAIISLIIFIILFLGLPVISTNANDFYRAGALVFGGGHVVLPLLEQTMVAAGNVSQADFLAGYGATQAVPGPMFSFAAYLGFLQADTGRFSGAMIATAMIFLPGFLLVIAILPFWQDLSTQPLLVKVIAGINSAVVGLLAAALYDPIFVHAVNEPIDLAIAAVAFGALSRFKLPVLIVVFGCVVIKIAVTSSKLI